MAVYKYFATFIQSCLNELCRFVEVLEEVRVWVVSFFDVQVLEFVGKFRVKFMV